MNDVDEMLAEFRRITLQLFALSEQQDFEPMLELIEHRLTFLAELSKLVSCHPEYKPKIVLVIQELSTVEKELMAKLVEQHVFVGKKLAELRKANQAERVYRDISNK